MDHLPSTAASKIPEPSPTVLLMRPPQEFLFGVWPRGPRLSIPTGLLSIASYLKLKGIETSIYDAFVEGEKFDEQFKSARTRRAHRGRLMARMFIDRSESTAQGRDFAAGRTHFGAPWLEIESFLRRAMPDIVGITNIFRENTQETIRLARLVKAVVPSALVVVGGPNANAQYRELLDKCIEIDVVGLGDGERPMHSLTEVFAGKIGIEEVPDIVYRSDGEIRRTAPQDAVMNLDEYGALEYSLLRLERYFRYEGNGIMARNKFLYPGSERAVSMVTSRGCPYKCSFCSIHIHAGRKFRRHSVDYILAQLEHLTKDCGVQHVHFEDDNLALDRRRFARILNGIIDRGINFTWDTPNGIFAETLDEEMLSLMKRAGCIYAIIGVESGVQRVLDDVVRKQPLKLSTVTRVFDSAQRVGLDLHAFYVIGFPRETMDEIDATLAFALDALVRYDIVPHLSLARADPGTELYREAELGGSLVRDLPIANAGGVRSDMFERNLIATSEFTPHDLEVKNEDFHAGAIRHILTKRLFWLARRPVDLLDVLIRVAMDVLIRRESPRESIVKLFWCNLLYPNAMKKLGAQARVIHAFRQCSGGPQECRTSAAEGI